MGAIASYLNAFESMGLAMITSRYLFLCALCFAAAQVADAQTCASNEVGGIVFHDYDADGTQDSAELGEEGVSVSAYASDNSLLATTSTNAYGEYVITGITAGTALRLEFSGLDSSLYYGPAASSGAGTSVRFVTADGSCSVDVGLSYPYRYCQSNPRIVSPRHVNGDPLLGGNAGTQRGFVSFLAGDDGQPPTATASSPKRVAFNSEVGATWGVAYQRSTKNIFAAALMKRHAGFGPLGAAGIYRIDVTDEDNPVVHNFLDLNSLGVSAGVDSHAGLPAAITVPNLDTAAYADVGKVAFGDLDISEDEETLWFVNLFDRTLYSLDIGLTPSTPTVSDLTAYPITDPGCANGDYRPWAIGIHRGQVYVGVVCTGETAQLSSQLHAYVLKLRSNGSGFDSVLDLPLNYTRGPILEASLGQKPGPDEWQAWTVNEASMGLGAVAFGDFIVYTQPILVDIEFDVDNTLILGFADRSGHQLGRANYLPTQTVNINPPSGGDVLRACEVGSGVWAIESNGSCGGVTTAGAANNQGPGGGEFYHEDLISVTGFPNVHTELFLGGLAHRFGSGELVKVAYDPFEFETQGTITSSNSTGQRVRGYQVVGDFLGNFGKAAGLGDIELICDPAPIQIGNRVWVDSDKNGQQDAGEEALSGVTVRLYDGSSNLVATAITGSSGEYLFSGLDPSTNYCIRLDTAADYRTGGPLSRYTLTTVNSVGDQRDSDATLVNAYPEICVTTGIAGDNVHTYDFGFVNSCTESSLSPAALSIDGGAFALQQTARQSLAYLNAQAKKIGGCSGLTTAKTIQQRARADAAYQALWTDLWGLGTTQYTCANLPSLCTQTDISSEIAALRSQALRIYNVIYRNLRGSCLRRKREARMFLKRAKELRNEIYGELAQYPTTRTECTF
jgi:hypothetical protein